MEIVGNPTGAGDDRATMSDAADRRALDRIVAGDPAALAELYDRHAGLLAVRLRRAGASRAETEDLLQETFLALWRSADTYRGEGAVAAWLWSIARRRLATLARRETRRRARESAWMLPRRHLSDEGAWATGMDVRRALELLDPEVRAAFEAVALDGLSIRDAAVRLGVPEGTVKSRVHRARARLRKEMG